MSAPFLHKNISLIALLLGALSAPAAIAQTTQELAESAATAASAAHSPAAAVANLTQRLNELFVDETHMAWLRAVPPSDARYSQAHAGQQRLQAHQQQRLRQLTANLVAQSHDGNSPEGLKAALDLMGSPEAQPALALLRPVLNEWRLQSRLPADLDAQLRQLVQQSRTATPAAAPAAPSEQALNSLLQSLLPAQGPAAEEAVLAKAAREREWRGLELPAHTVLLSFDDGPHAQHTPSILATLEEHKIKAIFFQLGRNLGERNKQGQIEHNRNEALEKQILAAGHAIGNHSFSHAVMPKLSEAQIKEEIELTQSLLELAVPPGPARTGMFRAPYGAVNEAVLAQSEAEGLRLVLWNVDSLDWKDPSPPSIVERVMAELDRAGRGIVLMHDIHAHTVEALPLLIKALKDKGYHFAHWDGQALVQTD